MTESRDAKQALRARVRESRAARGEAGAARLAPAFTEQQRQLAIDVDAKTVATYMSLPDEPDTRGFLAWTHAEGLRALLPISRSDGLLDWAEHDGQETVGAYGLPEPATPALPPNALGEVDLILVPASAVDEQGMRLGWGRGYFDKALATLQHCPPVYAVSFHDEIVTHVPSEAHDLPVNGVVTERGRREFTRS